MHQVWPSFKYFVFSQLITDRNFRHTYIDVMKLNCFSILLILCLLEKVTYKPVHQNNAFSSCTLLPNVCVTSDNVTLTFWKSVSVQHRIMSGNWDLLSLCHQEPCHCLSFYCLTHPKGITLIKKRVLKGLSCDFVNKLYPFFLTFVKIRSRSAMWQNIN